MNRDDDDGHVGNPVIMLPGNQEVISQSVVSLILSPPLHLFKQGGAFISVISPLLSLQYPV